MHLLGVHEKVVVGGHPIAHAGEAETADKTDVQRLDEVNAMSEAGHSERRDGQAGKEFGFEDVAVAKSEAEAEAGAGAGAGPGPGTGTGTGFVAGAEPEG